MSMKWVTSVRYSLVYFPGSFLGCNSHDPFLRRNRMDMEDNHRNEGWGKMKNIGNRFGCYLLGIVVYISLLPVALAANNIVPIRLPHGVQIELPRNWEALSKNQRITLDS